MIYSVTYVAYAGGEHPHSEYEVLCGCNPHWVQVEGKDIPPNAVPAGETAQGWRNLLLSIISYIILFFGDV